MRQVCFAGCRLQVAGCGLKFNYNWKTAGTYKNVQAVDLPWLLHDPVYDRSERLLPPSCQTGRSDGRRVYSNDFKPAMNYWFGINVWNIIWNSCWIWFLPREYQNESAQRACASIFRRLILYYFISLVIWQSSVVEGRPEPNLASMETSVERPFRYPGPRGFLLILSFSI